MNDVVGQSVHSHRYHEDSQANEQMTTIKVSSVLRQILEKLRERRFLREDEFGLLLKYQRVLSQEK